MNIYSYCPFKDPIEALLNSSSRYLFLEKSSKDKYSMARVDILPSLHSILVSSIFTIWVPTLKKEIEDNEINITWDICTTNLEVIYTYLYQRQTLLLSFDESIYRKIIAFRFFIFSLQEFKKDNNNLLLLKNCLRVLCNIHILTKYSEENNKKTKDLKENLNEELRNLWMTLQEN